MKVDQFTAPTGEVSEVGLCLLHKDRMGYFWSLLGSFKFNQSSLLN